MNYGRILQIQEKLRKDLETELMSVQDQVQDGTPRSTIILELQRSSMERLPPLKHVAAASWTDSGTTMDHKSIKNGHGILFVGKVLKHHYKARLGYAVLA
jgi:hypothetical protein